MALTNKLSAIGDAIREKTGKEDLIPLGDMPNEIRGIPQGGGNSEERAEKDNFLEYLKSIHAAFSNLAFPEGYEMILDIPNLVNINQAFFKSSGIRKVTLIGNVNKEVCNVLNAFNQAKDLEEIDITNFNFIVDDGNATFYAANKLKTILGEIDFSQALRASMFGSCSALEEVRFKPNTLSITIPIANSSNLSDASIESIINGLVDLTDSDTQTIMLHADVKAKLTETQIATITNKNWTLA